MEIPEKSIVALVTGAAGQLGSEIRQLAPAFKEFLFHFTDLNELDITKPESLSATLDKVKPNVIINCAAYTAVDKAESEPEAASLLNTFAVKNMAEECFARNILLLHISTDYVFDGRAYTPYTENHNMNPQGIYAVSKARAEEAVRDSGCQHLIIRTSWLYSSFGHNFLKTILRLSSERKEINVVADQTGTPTYAAPLAHTILKMILISQGRPELHSTYHVACEGVCSWYDFASEIVHYEGSSCKINPISTEEYPLPAPRPPYSVLSKAKLLRNFGLQMPHWRQAMIACMDALKNNRGS